MDYFFNRRSPTEGMPGSVSRGGHEQGSIAHGREPRWRSGEERTARHGGGRAGEPFSRQAFTPQARSVRGNSIAGKRQTRMFRVFPGTSGGNSMPQKHETRRIRANSKKIIQILFASNSRIVSTSRRRAISAAARFASLPCSFKKAAR